MKKLSYGLGFFILLLLQAKAYALTCEVDFRAKRDVREEHWFGNVERPEFRSGTVAGMGDNQRDCERDALAPIQEEGWVITFQRTRIVSEG
jgi:hypothetical protein